jgi:hypothetical protein
VTHLEHGGRISWHAAGLEAGKRRIGHGEVPIGLCHGDSIHRQDLHVHGPAGAWGDLRRRDCFGRGAWCGSGEDTNER